MSIYWSTPLLLAAAMLWCGGRSQEGAAAFAGFDPGTPPDSLRRGAQLFNSYCTSCHGVHGTGQGLGPPLLDTLYRPGRLPDEAIYRAVEQGVKSRHWHYGAMPPIKRVNRAELDLIVPYVRWLQGRVAPASRDTLGGMGR